MKQSFAKKQLMLMLVLLTLIQMLNANRRDFDLFKKNQKMDEGLLREWRQSSQRTENHQKTNVNVRNSRLNDNSQWNAYINPETAFAFEETETHLWIGTSYGIVRYDKQNDSYELLNNIDLGTSYNSIYSMKLAPGGDLWIGYRSFAGDAFANEGGISILHTDGTVTNLNRANSDLRGHAISGFLFDNEGNTWISYDSGCSSVGGISIINSEGEWTYLNSSNSNLPHNSVQDMLLDSQNRIWISMNGDYSHEGSNAGGGGLVMIENGVWTHFTTEILDYDTADHKRWDIRNLHEDSQGNIWFILSSPGTFINQTGQLFKYDNAEGTFLSYGEDLEGNGWLFAMTIDSSDRIWLSSLANDRFFLLCFEDDFWTDYTLVDIVQDVYADQNDRIWISLWGSDFGYLENGVVHYLEFDVEGIPLKYNHINRMAEYNGNVYIAKGEFGTYNQQKISLMINENSEWTTYGLERFGTYGAHDVKINNNNLVVATGPYPMWHDLAIGWGLQGGVATRENGNWTIHSENTTGYPFIWAFTADKDIFGNIWASGVEDGVALYNNTEWQIVYSLYTDIVFDILAERTGPVVWMATPFGLQRVTVSQSGVANYEMFHPGNSNLPSEFIYRLMFGRHNRMYVLTENGVAVYDNGNFENISILADDVFITCMTEDEYGRLWLGTENHGIIRIDNDDQVISFNVDNSPLPLNYIAEIVSDKNGMLYVNPFANGIYTFEYDEGTGINDNTQAIVKNSVDIYPNPFNPQTTIKFDLPKGDFIKIDIFNVKGQKVKTLLNSNLDAGVHQVVWNGTDDNNKELSSGVYFSKITHSGQTSVNKMLLMK